MSEYSQFTANLLEWFTIHSRDLPWRRTYDPYHVWVSEIMLQQTRMDRVVAYFSRWIVRFPTINILADAAEDEVLRLWEGLGYYSRARNLHKTARILCENGCHLPEDYENLLALPGIGPYTAGAIMSIAYNRCYPAVDANVERVFSRYFDLASPVKEKKNKSFILAKLKKMQPDDQCRFFNQALMELGALICLPATPVCHKCPVAAFCLSRQRGTTPNRPLLQPKKKTIRIDMATGIVFRKGKILIQKRLSDDVWANLWEFPGGRIKQGETPEQAVIREFFEETNLHINVTKKITTVQHSYMHYRVTLHGFFCEISDGKNKKPALHAAQENRWVAIDELKKFAFPAGHRKLIDYLLEDIQVDRLKAEG